MNLLDSAGWHEGNERSEHQLEDADQPSARQQAWRDLLCTVSYLRKDIFRMEQPQAGEFGKAEEGDSERGGGGKGEFQDTSFYSLNFQTLTGVHIIIELI